MQVAVTSKLEQQQQKSTCEDEILAVSCLNLRREDGTMRPITEKIHFNCTMCKDKKLLGKTSASIIRLTFPNVEEIFCDRCTDIFTEIGVFGPRVISEGMRWEMTSQVTRVAAIHEEMKCFRCDKTFSSHVYVKYQDVTMIGKVMGRSKGHHFLKICGVCSSEIVGWMRTSKVVKEYEFPWRKPVVLQRKVIPVRRWAQ